MKKFFILLAICLFSNINIQNVIAKPPCAVAIKDTAKIEKSAKPMPILAWSGLPMGLSTVERFKEVREAGFTHHLQVYGTLEDMKKVLTAAEQADVKIFLNALETTPEKKFYDEMAKYPALEGYFITDEPSDTKTFDKWGKIVKSIQALDSKHWCYINLLPTYGMPYIKNARDYKDYVDQFLTKVPVKVLTFDHYPVVPDGKGGASLRGDFYENLEIVKTSAEKFEKPFWAFVLSTSHSGYPVPSMEHLRYQVYSNLAYGAQGIQYFTYWTVTIPNMNFSTGPLDKHGKRTVVYDRAKVMNNEIQMLSGIFMDSKVTSVTHTGALPKGTRRYNVKAPFRSLECVGSGAVISEITKGNRRFLVVVNRSIDKPMVLKISSDNSKKIFEVKKKDASVCPIKEGVNKYKILPGDVQIFAWNAS